MDINYTIYPLLVGKFPAMEYSTQLYLTGYGQKNPAPILAFLVVGGGKTILVDTGADSGETSVQYEHTWIEQTEEMQPRNAIHNLGFDPDNLNFLIASHLHWDHCQHNHLFPGKKIYVQKAELEYAENPLPFYYVSYELEKVGLTPRWKLAREQFEIVDGDVKVLPGIELVLLPGHSPGSQGVLVNTADGKYLIAGDAVSCWDNLRGDKFGYRVPVTWHDNIAEVYQSFDRMVDLVAGDINKILPGHDMDVLKHKSYPPH